jgi:regulatory protein YycH of two-component signal transduction system YycFG
MEQQRDHEEKHKRKSMDELKATVDNVRRRHQKQSHSFGTISLNFVPLT